MSLNTNGKRGLWLAAAVVSMLSAGCPVDINDPIDDTAPPTPECPAAERVPVRFFHAAGGTKVIRPEFGPEINRSLTVTRPDFLVPSAADPTVMVPQTVITLAPGAGQVVRVCGGKPMTYDLKLQGASAPRVTSTFTFPAGAAATPTVIFAGIADVLNMDGTPENPASTANPLRLMLVTPAFAPNESGELVVAHASTRLGPVVARTASKETPAVTSETTVIEPYTASTPIAIRGSGDGISSMDTPVAVDVTAVEGETVKGKFTINPRFPAGAKGLAIVFDRIIFDPDAPAGTTVPAPQTRLFLTGDDPLLGSVRGGGITLTPTP